MAVNFDVLSGTLKLDTAPFQQGFSQAGTALNSFAGKIGSFAQTVGQRLQSLKPQIMEMGKKFTEAGQVAQRGMQNIATAATGLATALVGAGVAATKLASDANEAASKFQFVFTTASDKTQKALDEFAKAAQRSKYELREMAADIGALIGPMGFTAEETGKLSTSFTQLAVDLSSFFNVSEKDALIALRAAIVGESEPMRRLGVQLNEAKIQAEAFALGIAKSKAEVTGAIKTQAIFSIIMRETKTAQGDAERTADQFANSWRGMTGAIKDFAIDAGQVFIPVATRIVQAVRDIMAPMAQWMGNNRELIQNQLNALLNKLMAFWQSLDMGQKKLLVIAGAIAGLNVGLGGLLGNLPLVGGFAKAIGSLVNPFTLVTGSVKLLIPLISGASGLLPLMTALFTGPAAPFVIAAGLIAALGLAFDVFVLKGKITLGILGELGTLFREMLPGAIEAAKGAMEAFAAFLEGDFNNGMAGAMRAVGGLADAGEAFAHRVESWLPRMEVSSRMSLNLIAKYFHATADEARAAQAEFKAVAEQEDKIHQKQLKLYGSQRAVDVLTAGQQTGATAAQKAEADKVIKSKEYREYLATEESREKILNDLKRENEKRRLEDDTKAKTEAFKKLSEEEAEAELEKQRKAVDAAKQRRDAAAASVGHIEGLRTATGGLTPELERESAADVKEHELASAAVKEAEDNLKRATEALTAARKEAGGTLDKDIAEAEREAKAARELADIEQAKADMMAEGRNAGGHSGTLESQVREQMESERRAKIEEEQRASIRRRIEKDEAPEAGPVEQGRQRMQQFEQSRAARRAAEAMVLIAQDPHMGQVQRNLRQSLANSSQAFSEGGTSATESSAMLALQHQAQKVAEAFQAIIGTEGEERRAAVTNAQQVQDAFNKMRAAALAGGQGLKDLADQGKKAADALAKENEEKQKQQDEQWAQAHNMLAPWQQAAQQAMQTATQHAVELIKGSASVLSQGFGGGQLSALIAQARAAGNPGAALERVLFVAEAGAEAGLEGTEC